MGFVGLALGAMLHRDGIARADDAEPAGRRPTAGRIFPPRAKRVIWLLMRGGVSHLESFDPKPALDQLRRQDDRRDAVQVDGLRLAVPQERPRAGRQQHHRQAEGARSIPRRSASRRAGRAGSRSATGGRTCAAASTTSPWSARCARPTTTTAPSSSSSPAGICSTAASRRSAPGSTTAWGR